MVDNRRWIRHAGLIDYHFACDSQKNKQHKTTSCYACRSLNNKMPNELLLEERIKREEQARAEEQKAAAEKERQEQERIRLEEEAKRKESPRCCAHSIHGCTRKLCSTELCGRQCGTTC